MELTLRRSLGRPIVFSSNSSKSKSKSKSKLLFDSSLSGLDFKALYARSSDSIRAARVTMQSAWLDRFDGFCEYYLCLVMERGHLEIGDKVVGEKSLDGRTEEAIQKRDFGANRFNVPTFQRHDVVKSKDNGMIGIVIEVGGDLDSESDMTDDDEEDEDEEENEGEEEEGDNDSGSENGGKGDDDKNDPLPTGQVRVFWMNQSETTQNLEEVTLIDRAFLHGDIVSASSDPMGQVGVVTNVEISVDLMDQDGSMIKDISARDLKRVRDFTVGDYVVLGPWLGRVDDVLDNVTVLFDDGAMCKVMKVDPLRLTSLSKGILEDGDYPYYPGQRVRASSSAVFKNARWLSGSWKASRLEGTITKVTVGSVFIYWIASAGCGSESLTAPAEEQGPKNLKLLSCLTHANWQVGDWCFLPSCVPSSYVSKDRNSLFITPKIASSVEFVSGAMEGEHISESLPDKKVDGNRPLFTNVESMALDKVDIDNLDINGEQEKNHTSPESSPCSSSLSVSKEPLHENGPLRRKKIRKVVIKRDKKARKKEENFDRSLLIVNSKTKVDVAWQDGRRELGLASVNLIPIDNPGDQEFLPEQYVVEKCSDDNDDDNAHEVRRVGVVKSVNANERTACVRWLKSVSRPEDPREFDKEEIVSVYELEVHSDYDYCYGDVVVRLSTVSVSSNVIGIVNPLEESGLCDDHNNAEKDLMTEEDASSCGVLAGFSDLSWVGNITGLQDGDIEVTWANEMVSTVGPQAIYVVGRDDDEPSEYGSEVSDGAASWETVDEDGMNTLDNTGEEIAPQDGSCIIPEAETTVDLEDCNSGGKGALAIPLAALGFVTRLATGFFSLGRKQNDSFGSGPSAENVPQSLGIADLLEQISSNVDSSSLSTNIMNNHAAQTVNDNFEEQGPILEVAEVEEPLCNLRSEEPDVQSILGCISPEVCSFKRFDTAKDPLDHFFLGANGQSSDGRKWLKKVHQDWGILQKNLPESIYVRIYEDRMDLLRAVIVGAYGTPYQDGLFVFDFHLPPEYPQCPPSAHYHSGGWRINPNLYEEGKVCLSLLNTWTGRGNEVWDSSSSSILQILVSLQGLVLNSKPYFNEAGYDKQVGTAEGEKNSLSYNENTFLLNCKSMMYLIRRPPKDFEELIKEHFRRRGYYILKACDAYMTGCLIGSLTKDASVSENSNGNSTSVGFKLMLAKIMPKLIAALSEVGADVHEFNRLQQS